MIRKALAGRLRLSVLGLLLAVLPLGSPVVAQDEEGDGASAPDGDFAVGNPASTEEERPQLTTFEIRLEDGSTVTGQAREVSTDGSGKWQVFGVEEILYQDISIKADQIDFDSETQDVVASGNVVFDQGPERLTGDSLEINLETELGRIINATGNSGTDYFFTGREVIKTGENQYRILDGAFSSCEGEVPAWSFRTRRADVTLGGYAKVRGATFRAKKLPLLYSPYILWPVMSDRTSGFLVPKPGYSERRGISLGLAYYWAINRSWDATFQTDLFSGDGGGLVFTTTETGESAGYNYLGFGTEVRYKPSEGTEGIFEGYGIRDPDRDETRWRMSYHHESRNLPAGMRAVINYEDASDFDYFLDFERRGDRHARRQLYSTAYLTGNWGPHSLNLNLDQRETFINADRNVTLRQLPELEYKLRSTRIGSSPLYLDLRSSVHYLDVERTELQDNSYARADLFPNITLPIRTLPWLQFSFTAGGRLTWYGDSLTESSRLEADRTTDFSGESITRAVPTASAEIVGPSFSKIFDSGGKKFSKFKHLIEPRITYSFLDDYEDQALVPLFDEVDRVSGANVARFSLFNRLLAKPAEEGGGGAFEILSFELSQDFSFDDEKPLQIGGLDENGVRREKQQGPVRARLRYSPSNRTQIDTDVRYNTLFGAIESASLSSTLRFSGQSRLGVRWTTRIDPERDDTLTHQVRVSSRFPIVARRLFLDSSINYDILREEMILQRHLLRFQGSCYSVNLELGEYRRGELVDREFRFSLSLKNVGTFLDFTGGSHETF